MLSFLKDSQMGPFSGDFQRGGDSERNIHYFSAPYIGPTACIIARIVWITTRAEHYSIEKMRWAPLLDMIDVLFAFVLYV